MNPYNTILMNTFMVTRGQDQSTYWALPDLEPWSVNAIPYIHTEVQFLKFRQPFPNIKRISKGYFLLAWDENFSISSVYIYVTHEQNEIKESEIGRKKKDRGRQTEIERERKRDKERESISLHRTTLTKWHFVTMKSSLCATYITELIYFTHKITQNITIKS